MRALGALLTPFFFFFIYLLFFFVIVGLCCLTTAVSSLSLHSSLPFSPLLLHQQPASSLPSLSPYIPMIDSCIISVLLDIFFEARYRTHMTRLVLSACARLLNVTPNRRL
jgi:hypothetical protein